MFEKDKAYLEERLQEEELEKIKIMDDMRKNEQEFERELQNAQKKEK